MNSNDEINIDLCYPISRYFVGSLIPRTKEDIKNFKGNALFLAKSNNSKEFWFIGHFNNGEYLSGKIFSNQEETNPLTQINQNNSEILIKMECGLSAIMSHEEKMNGLYGIKPIEALSIYENNFSYTSQAYSYKKI